MSASTGGTDPNQSPSAALAARIVAWERIVAQVEHGYALDLDDWLNDMDLRGAIATGLEAATARDSADKALLGRLAAADRRFRRATVGAGKCLWGSAVAAREGWHAGRQWWYFRKPRAGNAALEQDIEKTV